MPLTRSFRETVQARARRDVKFRQALLAEAMQVLLDGNLEEGRSALRSCIKATIGFEKLGTALGRSSKSSMRMFGPSGKRAESLDADEFVAAVRSNTSKKHKLTASQISELKREHAKTIEPLRKTRLEIFLLEKNLSDLVNAAYGLSPDEVNLMWSTAPPRMPFTPAGLTSEELAAESDDEEN